jgi:hypothetical protein
MGGEPRSTLSAQARDTGARLRCTGRAPMKTFGTVRCLVKSCSAACISAPPADRGTRVRQAPGVPARSRGNAAVPGNDTA